MFKKLFVMIDNNTRKSDIIIYLHRPMNVLMDNIKKRGRVFEQNIEREYLTKVHSAYMDYFKQQTHYPVLVLDLGSLDLNKQEGIQEYCIALLERDWEAKIHYLEY